MMEFMYDVKWFTFFTGEKKQSYWKNVQSDPNEPEIDII